MARQMDIIRPALTVTRVSLLQSVLTASHQHHHVPSAIHFSQPCPQPHVGHRL